jgi:hypothetical protein
VAEATTFAADGRPVECNHNYSNLCPVIPSVDDKTLWNVQATGTGYNNLREKVTKL